MNQGKMEVIVTAQVETFMQAKELLDDLEVLNEKYDVQTSITICPQVNVEAFYKLP
ncbi:hypothetical protein NQQ93_002410 [Listeria monocytogenes]|nr:hypothetical protein [Listeria monocytogenes]